MSPSPLVEPPAPFTVAVVDVAAADADASTIARREAAGVLERAVGPDHADDRFEPYDRSDDGSVLVLARIGDEAVGYVGAGSSRGRLQLDVVADTDRIAQIAGNDPTGVLEPLVLSMIDRATSDFDQRSPVASSDLVFELWGRPRRAWHDRLAERLDLRPVRSLHQMRCPLPLPDAPAATDRTRPIDPAADTEQLLEVNNRAFSSHPDQSNQRLTDLESSFAQPSFRPESVRILDAEPADDRAARHPMIGFCWTKIHPERPGRAPLGEIYVIAVDPAYHGEGHGTGLTTAGLRWLARQGLSTGMLYVESDNDPAVATYRNLGFTVHDTSTAWGRP